MASKLPAVSAKWRLHQELSSLHWRIATKWCRKRSTWVHADMFQRDVQKPTCPQLLQQFYRASVLSAADCLRLMGLSANHIFPPANSLLISPLAVQCSTYIK